MSNGHKLELMPWGDGTLRLAYWDSLHGEDAIFVLNEDGTAAMSTHDANENEVLVPVNLVQALRVLADKLYGNGDGD